MDMEQLGNTFDELLDKSEALIEEYCKNNGTMIKEVKLLLRRSIRLARLAIYALESEQTSPVQLYETGGELMAKSTNAILNEVKRLNNIKRFNKEIGMN